MSRTNTIAVIGAGAAGLPTIKELTQEDLKVVAFEQRETLGGMWSNPHGPAWKDMRTNLSKYTCCYSTYPHTKQTPDFPLALQMGKYLELFAKSSRLEDYVRLEHKVREIIPSPDGWQVAYQNKSGKEKVESFSKVVIATGFFSKAVLPEIQGQENFSGLRLPASRYECAEKFQDKDVIVVGNGLSGVEICSDLCRAAKSVTHIIRRPAWIIPRYLPNPEGFGNIPLDLLFYRRSNQEQDMPISAEERNCQRNRWFSTLSKQNNLALEELRIDPNSQDFIPVAISDSYLRLVELGYIKVTRADGIKKFKTDSVFIGDGRKFKADAVIFATGYKFELPFLADELKSKLQFSPEDQLQPAILYKETFNRDLPGLYFVGTYKGPFLGTMELQARLIAGLASGRITISDDSYRQGIQEELEIRLALPRPQFPHADYVKFTDGLAKDVGCFPELSLEDPLRHAIFQGPVIPAHYRVSGTGSEKKKAEAIIKEVNKITTAK